MPAAAAAAEPERPRSSHTRQAVTRASDLPPKICLLFYKRAVFSSASNQAYSAALSCQAISIRQSNSPCSAARRLNELNAEARGPSASDPTLRLLPIAAAPASILALPCLRSRLAGGTAVAKPRREQSSATADSPRSTRSLPANGSRAARSRVANLCSRRPRSSETFCPSYRVSPRPPRQPIPFLLQFISRPRHQNGLRLSTRCRSSHPRQFRERP